MSDNVKYICKKCQYRFSMKKDTAVTIRCPYCSDESVAEDTFDVDQAIQEASGI